MMPLDWHRRALQRLAIARSDPTENAAVPTVCAVMLTAGRPEMARQATECWRKQMMPCKLLAFDTGREPCIIVPALPDACGVWLPSLSGTSIAMLRNAANQWAIDRFAPDILIHLDDDDWSHPARVAEQVEFLHSSGAECVGYNEMLFWRQAEREAWLYRNPHPAWALGTSLCYWTRAWEKQKFPDSRLGRGGEDTAWLKTVRCASVSSVAGEPRMIARIHPGNVANPAYDRREMARNAALRPHERQWTRAPEWDEHCAGVFGCA